MKGMDSKRLNAYYEKKTFIFKQPSGTSRGILTEKNAWFISLSYNLDEFIAVGECSIIPGLSPDFVDFEQYENKLTEVCNNIDFYVDNLKALENYPSILFGLETALLALNSKDNYKLFDTPFVRGVCGIPINGLIWMGSKEFMLQQIEEKLNQGFSCLKMKVGAIDFESEIALLKSIRNVYSSDDIELRLDANGAFDSKDAIQKLSELSKFDIHSIEQPIKQGQLQAMKDLCKSTPIPIALDEELIGFTDRIMKEELIAQIQPQYIILKPSLHGGLMGSTEWIEIANNQKIPWWITSALESNIGLNAIAQFASIFENKLPQGLGTGGLYLNNSKSQLEIKNGVIYFCNR
jgi:o-succinylbenzoate synthase